jgi:hypothetical protein
MKINIRFTLYIFLFIYKSIYCQPNQTIPVVECIGDFTLSFLNGNNLKFKCDEKNTEINKIIRADPAANNFQFPYVKNYNQSSYDLIWADEFNGSTIDNNNWRGNLSYHYGLLNKRNINDANAIGPPNLDYGAGFMQLPSTFNISNGTIKLTTRHYAKW